MSDTRYRVRKAKKGFENSRTILHKEISQHNLRIQFTERLSIALLAGLGLLCHILAVIMALIVPTTPFLTFINYFIGRDFLINMAAGFYTSTAIFYLLNQVLIKRQDSMQRSKLISARVLTDTNLNEENTNEHENASLLIERVQRLIKYTKDKSIEEKIQTFKICLKLAEEALKSLENQMITSQLLIQSYNEIMRIAFDSGDQETIKVVQKALKVQYGFSKSNERLDFALRNQVEVFKEFLQENDNLEQ